MTSYTQKFQQQLSAGQLGQLFNFLPDIYFVVKNREGQVMMANEVAVKMCGFKNEKEMLGKTDYDIFPRDRADAYVQDDHFVFDTGQRIVDRVELAPDSENSINWFVTTKIPVYSHDDKIIGLACIARNMSDAYTKLRPYVEMNDILEYVRENYANPVRIEELAKIAHLSTSQFERRFRKIFQITPTKHILNVRIRAACKLLLSTDNTISSIALDSGFYDHSHFIRGFKKTMGMSPKEYRVQRWEKP